MLIIFLFKIKWRKFSTRNLITDNYAGNSIPLGNLAGIGNEIENGKAISALVLRWTSNVVKVNKMILKLGLISNLIFSLKKMIKFYRI